MKIRLDPSWFTGTEIKKKKFLSFHNKFVYTHIYIGGHFYRPICLFSLYIEQHYFKKPAFQDD